MKEHQPQATTESEDSAEIEDVKVCDICGDAGQEELLAFCSRCTDGAEHTYCMRTRLCELPEGDWLCEACKIKEETENQSADESETYKGQLGRVSLNKSISHPNLLPGSEASIQDCGACGASEEVDLNNSKKVSESTVSLSGSTSNPKPFQESDTSIPDSEARGTNEEVHLSESTGISVGAAISKAKCVLSRGSSFSFLEVGKLKQAKLAASCGGPLSKSVSFINSNVKPMVKQLIGTVPQKQIISRDFTSREGWAKKSSESSSFRGASSGCFSTEPIIKIQGLPSSCAEDHRVLKKEEGRNIVEKESSIEQPLFGPAPMVVVSSYPNPEAQSNVLHMNRYLDTNNSGSEAKKASYISKSFVRSSSTIRGQKLYPTHGNVNVCTSAADRSCNIPATILQNTAPRIVEFTHTDDKLEDSMFPNVPKQGSSGGRRKLHCRKSIEAGHPTHLCSIDKLYVSSLEPSADQNPREVQNDSSKWKDTMNAALSKLKMLKNARSVDVLKTSVADPSKTAPMVDVNLQATQLIEASCSSKGSNSKPILVLADTNRMKVEPSPQISLNEASAIPNISRASVIPKLESIWQGGFEVLRRGRLSKFCDGVQAHLSTFASSEVLEAAIKFPGKVQLEEVTCCSSWPWQFQGSSPDENNIGLFFFAKNFESYEKNYCMLLEDMIKNDLALKGNIEGSELLVFPSNKLPPNCQHWNRLFFLWGVFCRKNSSCHETLPHSQEKPCKSSLVPLFQDLMTPGAQTPSQKFDSYKNPDDEILISDGSPEARKVKPSFDVDLQPKTSGVQMNAKQLCNGANSKVSFLKNSGSEGTENVDPPCYEKLEGGDSLMTDEAFLDNNPGQNVTESGPNGKCAFPMSIEAFSHVVDEEVSSTTGLMQLNEKVTFPPVDDRREHKKMKLADSETMIAGRNESHFFPMDLDPMKDMKSDTVRGLTLEKDGRAEPEVPNLELELGGKKELPKEEVLPLSSPKIKDEVYASLSLSLAFDASKE